VWTSKVFCFHTFFNFLLVILGFFNFFMWSFTRGEIRYLISSGNFEGLLFWYFEVLNFSIFFLSFWGSSNFFVWSFHKWGNEVCAFLHVNFESFLFSYFEIPESSKKNLSFWRFHMGEIMLGVLF
jgi:hypothetical protein